MSCFTSSRAHDPLTVLVGGADPDRRGFLVAQLDADGHTVYEADRAAAVLAKLSCYAVDVLMLGELQRPREATGLLRGLRAGEHERIHPQLAVITLGAGDELAALRAYEAGSDHHLPDSTGYVLVRAVLASVTGRVLTDGATARRLVIGEITVDLTSRTVTVAGTPARVSRLEFELLATFASQPTRVFSKHELARSIWRSQISQRTVDSHISRLRSRLTAAGAGPVLITRWGQGWALTTPTTAAH